MADQIGNIDLIFRNGLRDYEVLPPADAWEGIKPSISTGTRFLPFMKVAAAAVLMAVTSYAAYRWGSEVTKNQFSDTIALYQQDGYMLVNEPFDVVKPPAISELPPENKAESVPDQVIMREAAIPEIDANEAGKNVTEFITADYNLLPGIQDPFIIKYPKVSIPSFQPLFYDIIQANSQTVDNERWSVSALASPTFYSQFTSSGNQFARDIISSDKSKVSYSGGLGLAYKISGRFTIQSGIFYSSMGQKLEDVNAYSGFQPYASAKSDHNFEIVTASGTVYANNSDLYLNSSTLPGRVQTDYTSDVFDPVKADLNYISSNVYQDMSFLELPVIMRYKVIDRKIGLNLIGGMSYNFLVNNSVYAMASGNKYDIGTTQGLNTVYLSSSLGMGMEYNLSKTFSLNVEPTLRYYLNPVNSGGTSVFHPYSLGIFSGLSYRF